MEDKLKKLIIDKTKKYYKDIGPRYKDRNNFIRTLNLDHNPTREENKCVLFTLIALRISKDNSNMFSEEVKKASDKILNFCILQ